MGLRESPVENLAVNPTFWRDKKVLLTGHTGFKGAWLSLWLHSLGARLTGYSLAPPSTPSLFELARVSEGIESFEGDVRDLEALARRLSESRAEIVIHMAAQSLVRRSYANPVETYETNVMGTVNLLEAVRRAGQVRAVVVVTSDKCYENREWVWGYRESDPMGGHDPYSNSKGCAELVTAAYRKSFFETGDERQSARIASARAGNVIGGGDWAEDRLLPDVFRALLEERAVAVRNPAATRPWQHVLEPLGGYLLLAERLYGDDGARYADGWNFGPREEDARPVAWVVGRVGELWKTDGAGSGRADDDLWTRDERGGHPHEARYLKLDCSKAHQELGWRPRWGLDEGLRATVEWYRAYGRGADVRSVVLNQISSYQNILREG